MAYQMSRKQYAFSILYGQIMIAVLVVLNVFYPQYLSYTFIIFIVGMVIFTAIMMKSQLKGLIGKEAKEIKSGRRLFVSNAKEVTELQRLDTKLIAELKPMLKSSMLSFLILIVLFIWYPLYFGHAKALAASADVMTRVAIFLAGYEIPYVAITFINQLSRRAVKSTVQVITNYEVYDKGVVGTGIAIKFPLESKYYVEVSPSRKFVDIVMMSGRMKVKYRLYTRNVSRLIEIIKRYGKPSKIEYES